MSHNDTFQIVNSIQPATINTEQNLSNNNLTGEDLVIIEMKIVTSNEKETPNNKLETTNNKLILEIMKL